MDKMYAKRLRAGTLALPGRSAAVLAGAPHAVDGSSTLPPARRRCTDRRIWCVREQ